jgi:D-alanine-D-alanine ligase
MEKQQIEILRKMKIAVLMGGKSGEREISLKSGRRVLESLRRQGFKAVGMDIVDDNFLENLRKEKIEIVFIALHGRCGEDGTIQGTLDLLGIPYTGSGVLASALGMNKVASKRIFESAGIPTPRYYVIEKNKNLKDECKNIIEKLGLPVITKPVSEGSSLGITIVREEEKLLETIKLLIRDYEEGFAEEFIEGKIVTVGILGVNETLRALPVLELIPKSDFYDYKAKYTKGMTQFVLPAKLEEGLYKKTQDVALKAHKILGCHGFSRVDIVVSKEGVPYVHDVNTIPGLTELSDLPAEAEVAGISYDELILEILLSALNK